MRPVPYLNYSSISTENRYEIPEDVQIQILADVASPLCGHGATHTFGKQKVYILLCFN